MGIGVTASTPRLKVSTSAGAGVDYSAGYFENTYTTNGIGLSVFNRSNDVALYVENKDNVSSNIAKFCSSNNGADWKEVFKLEGDGNIRGNYAYIGTGTGSDLYMTTAGYFVRYSSSKRYKDNINKLNVDYNKFMSLNPVSFEWNKNSLSEGVEDYGLIAEEVEKIDTKLASYNEDKTVEGVNYQKVNIMLLKVVQDQQKKIEEYETRLSNIEKILTTLNK